MRKNTTKKKKKKHKHNRTQRYQAKNILDATKETVANRLFQKIDME